MVGQRILFFIMLWLPVVVLAIVVGLIALPPYTSLFSYLWCCSPRCDKSYHYFLFSPWLWIAIAVVPFFLISPISSLLASLLIECLTVLHGFICDFLRLTVFIEWTTALLFYEKLIGTTCASPSSIYCFSSSFCFACFKRLFWVQTPPLSEYS